MAAGDSKSIFLPSQPFHLAQRAMASATNTPTHEGILWSEAGDGRNRAIQPDDQRKKVEWWKTMFKVVSQIESLELRNKFSGVVENDDGEKCRVCAFLYPRQWRTEALQYVKLLNEVGPENGLPRAGQFRSCAVSSIS